MGTGAVSFLFPIEIALLDYLLMMGVREIETR